MLPSCVIDDVRSASGQSKQSIIVVNYELTADIIESTSKYKSAIVWGWPQHLLYYSWNKNRIFVQLHELSRWHLHNLCFAKALLSSRKWRTKQGTMSFRDIHRLLQLDSSSPVLPVPGQIRVSWRYWCCSLAAESIWRIRERSRMFVEWEWWSILSLMRLTWFSV